MDELQPQERNRRGQLLLAAGILGAGVLALFLRGGGGSGPGGLRPGAPAGGDVRTPGPGSPVASSPAPGAEVPAEVAGPLEALARALATKDEGAVRTAAASLRRRLRKDPEACRRAASILLDPAASAPLRRAIALVFGTFDGEESDRVLLSVLRMYPEDAALVRCALLALGGAREPEEDDDVFGLGDRPWGARGPAGLGITVRREVREVATRNAMERFLGGTDPAVRVAAAEALRHTLAAGDVRDAFIGTLPGETADEVAEVLGEALAGRAGGTPDPADRREIVGALLARAGDERLDGFRFRMEDDLQRVPLEPGARRTLEGLAASGRSFAVRSFALAALSGSASLSGPEAESGTRSLLAALLGADPDPAVRDLAARLLHRLPCDAVSDAALAQAARQDVAWNVRFTAVETLAGCGDRPGIAEALQAASSDPDPRVAARARELRAKLAPK